MIYLFCNKGSLNSKCTSSVSLQGGHYLSVQLYVVQGAIYVVLYYLRTSGPELTSHPVIAEQEYIAHPVKHNFIQVHTRIILAAKFKLR